MTKAYAPKIALYGGAFDPIHRGHEAVIDFLRKEIGFTAVWLLPSGDSELKKSQVSASHRLKMIGLALKGRTDVLVEPFEANNPGPHWTSKTLEHLCLPKDDITFVMGSDQFIQFEKWKNFPNVLAQCHWFILYRLGVSMIPILEQRDRLKSLGILRSEGADHFKTPGDTHLIFHPVKAPELSSSQIRRELALFGSLHSPKVEGDPRTSSFPNKGSWALSDAFLHPDVDSYLKDHELYGRVR